MLSSCDTMTTSTETDIAKEVVAPLLQDCEGFCGLGDPIGVFDRPKACYDCMVANYATNGYVFPKTPDGKDYKGFLIQHGELQEMLEAIGDTTATVHAMMGIMGEGKDPHLVFAVKSEGAFSYYDFTTPCPNYCPK
jgi:hypothetical protein